MYGNGRVQDFALLLGHLWRCSACRESLLAQPELFWVGYKLDQAQRDCIKSLSDESFHTVVRLAEVSGLSVNELYVAIDHPRARLRHLDGHRYDFRVHKYTGTRVDT
jgi:3'-phosphoadenosine 5'-phosphosulfate sulfotransferase